MTKQFEQLNINVEQEPELFQVLMMIISLIVAKVQVTDLRKMCLTTKNKKKS